MADTTIEDGLYAAVAYDNDISGYIDNRFYANLLPQNEEYPNAVFQRITTNKIHTQGKDSGVSQTLYQINIYSESYDECVLIREAFRALLQDFSGDLGGVDITVLAVLLDDSDEGWDSTIEKYYQRLDFEINHLESRSI